MKQLSFIALAPTNEQYPDKEQWFRVQDSQKYHNVFHGYKENVPKCGLPQPEYGLLDYILSA